jgi:hypothetical protein
VPDGALPVYRINILCNIKSFKPGDDRKDKGSEENPKYNISPHIFFPMKGRFKNMSTARI